MLLVNLFVLLRPKFNNNCGIFHLKSIKYLNFHAKNLDFENKIAFWTLKNTNFEPILARKIKYLGLFPTKNSQFLH